jgi:hypothetical protein
MKKINFIITLCTFSVLHCADASKVELELKEATSSLVLQLENYNKTSDSILQMLKKASLDYDYLVNSSDLDFLFCGVRAYISGESSSSGIPAHLSWPYSTVSDVSVFGELAYASRLDLIKRCIKSLNSDDVEFAGLYEALSDLADPSYYMFYSSELANTIPRLHTLTSIDGFDEYLKDFGFSGLRSFENNLNSLMMSIYVKDPTLTSDFLLPILVKKSVEAADLLASREVDGQEMDLIFRTVSNFREKLNIQINPSDSAPRRNLESLMNKADQFSNLDQEFIRGFISELVGSSVASNRQEYSVEDLIRKFILYSDLMRGLDSSIYGQINAYFLQSYQ